MIVDTSAIIAILRDEPDTRSCATAIAEANTCSISAVNYVEAAVLIDASRDPIASRRLDDFFRAAGLRIDPATEAQARIAF